MTLVAPIRLQYDPKILWFDPAGLDIKSDDPVIVETARGLEYGTAAGNLTEVEDDVIAELKSPLKPVLRIATEEDEIQRLEMRRLSYEALPIFKEIAAETNESMHPVMVEYLFDGSKAIFLFESEERNDFRELVRRLTAKLHIRVDMRQIGVRDGARIIGGLGHCGQELCCCRLGGEFCPVSIRMAKAQDLSLNPQQISGVCGRLMCCLRYEYDTYKDFKSRAPKQNALIDTPEGPMRVCELDTPHEQVVLRTEEGKRIRIPLSEFDPPEEGMNRPKSIGDAFFTYANQDNQQVSTASLGDISAFTVQDKLAEGGQIHHNKVRREQSHGAEESQDKRPGASFRRRRRSSASQKQEGTNSASETRTQKSPETAKQPKPAKSQQGKDGKDRESQEKKLSSSARRRRRRSAARGKDAAKQAQDTASQNQNHQKAKQQRQPESKADAAPKAPAASSHRRARRRSHRTGGEGNES
ncbi:MAG: stage 0 sporulation family protein [Eggerthellaceae bacterium]